MELPAGVVLNPTVIAMRQAAKEQAERAQRAGSNRVRDTTASNESIRLFVEGIGC